MIPYQVLVEISNVVIMKHATIAQRIASSNVVSCITMRKKIITLSIAPKTCTPACSVHGACVDGVCICVNGDFTGPTCAGNSFYLFSKFKFLIFACRAKHTSQCDR